MKTRFFSIVLFSFYFLPICAQDGYLPIEAYKKWDKITTKTINLPEYNITDDVISELLRDFVESEKNREYYDEDAYILVKKWSSDSLSFMSIYPNMLDYSWYGSYDGVMYLHKHTFIISLGNHDIMPFVLTGRHMDVEFLELTCPPFYMENGKYHVVSVPDPYEVGYDMWIIVYNKGVGLYSITKQLDLESVNIHNTIRPCLNEP